MIAKVEVSCTSNEDGKAKRDEWQKQKEDRWRCGRMMQPRLLIAWAMEKRLRMVTLVVLGASANWWWACRRWWDVEFCAEP